MIEELKLTSEQVKALKEFKAAVLKLRDAGILPIDDRYSNRILFINGKNIEKQWIGVDFDECPFITDLNPIENNEIKEHNLHYDVLFANHFLPEEFLCVELKK